MSTVINHLKFNKKHSTFSIHITTGISFLSLRGDEIVAFHWRKGSCVTLLTRVRVKYGTPKSLYKSDFSTPKLIDFNPVFVQMQE